MAKKEEAMIVIPTIEKKRAKLRIVGDSRLVTHKFSEKAKRQLKEKHEKKAKQGRGVRKPEEEYAASMYWLDANGEEQNVNGDPVKHKTGFGFPAKGLKKCAVNAAVDVVGLAKTTCRRSFFVEPKGGFVKINGSPVMREDVVLVGGKGAGTGSADLRYRGEFWPWSIDFEIEYNAKVISLEQIINLFNLAGFSTGIGEQRPEKDDAWGMFHIEGISA